MLMVERNNDGDPDYDDGRNGDGDGDGDDHPLLCPLAAISSSLS